jgi:hypothetical protein
MFLFCLTGSLIQLCCNHRLKAYGYENLSFQDKVQIPIIIRRIFKSIGFIGLFADYLIKLFTNSNLSYITRRLSTVSSLLSMDAIRKGE